MTDLAPATVTLAQLLLLAGTLTAAILTPGPAILACIRAAAAHGVRAALPYALGLAFGASLWGAFALLGLTALFRVVPALYLGLRIFGGLYLLWFAYKLWSGAREPLTEGGRAGSFWQGVALNLSNPKPALFYSALVLAIFPGLLDWAQTAEIYAAAWATETFWYALVALTMSTPPVRRAYLAAKAWIDRAAALTMAGLGLMLLWKLTE